MRPEDEHLDSYIDFLPTLSGLDDLENDIEKNRPPFIDQDGIELILSHLKVSHVEDNKEIEAELEELEPDEQLKQLRYIIDECLEETDFVLADIIELLALGENIETLYLPEDVLRVYEVLVAGSLTATLIDRAVVRRFAEIAEEELFETNVSLDEVIQAYLNSFDIQHDPRFQHPKVKRFRTEAIPIKGRYHQSFRSLVDEYIEEELKTTCNHLGVRMKDLLKMLINYFEVDRSQLDLRGIGQEQGVNKFILRTRVMQLFLSNPFKLSWVEHRLEDYLLDEDSGEDSTRH